jgi:hypothetical protein
MRRHQKPTRGWLPPYKIDSVERICARWQMTEWRPENGSGVAVVLAAVFVYDSHGQVQYHVECTHSLSCFSLCYPFSAVDLHVKRGKTATKPDVRFLVDLRDYIVLLAKSA